MWRWVSIIPGMTMPPRRVDLEGTVGGGEPVAHLGHAVPDDEDVAPEEDRVGVVHRQDRSPAEHHRPAVGHLVQRHLHSHHHCQRTHVRQAVG